MLLEGRYFRATERRYQKDGFTHVFAAEFSKRNCRGARVFTCFGYVKDLVLKVLVNERSSQFQEVDKC